MPRLRKINPATDTGPGADILNGPLKDKQINIFKGLAVNPPVFKAILNFMEGVKGHALTPAEHEVMALVAGQKRDCEYCLSAHTALAKGVGIDEDAAADIRRGRGRDSREQTLIDFTAAMLDTEGFVSDEQLDDFRAAGFDDDAVIEVIAAIAVNTITNYYNHINATEIDFPVAASV